MAKNNQSSDSGAAAATHVFKVDLHCEGCAHKLTKSLKHITGVDTVKTNSATNRVTVIGNLDPAIVKTRLEEKTKKTVEFVSVPATKKPDEKPEKKTAVTKNAKEAEIVVLKTNVHCEGCVVKMNKIISKYGGVESVKVDLAKDQITIKGSMDVKAMLPYLVSKLKRKVEAVAPPPEKKAEKEKEKEKKAEKGGGSVEKIVNKMEYQGLPYYGYGTHVYDPRAAPPPEYGYVAEYGHAPSPGYGYVAEYGHAPQMFSDENPNACSIM